MRIFLSVAVLVAILLSSCVKDNWDVPPTSVDCEIESNTTIADLKALYDGSNALQITAEEDIVIKGIVIGNDLTGNIYKNIMIADSTGGVTISVDGFELNKDYQIGREIAVVMTDLYIGEYNGLPSIGTSVNSFGDVGRIPEVLYRDRFFVCEYQGEPVPDLITLSDVNDANLNKLVIFQDVQFLESDIDDTYAVPGGGGGVNRLIEDCSGNTLVVRMSDFASFAAEPLPNCNGSIKGVLTKFGSTYQLALTTNDDVMMNSPRCGETTCAVDTDIVVGNLILEKDFEDDDLTSGGWTNVQVVGTDSWVTNDQFAEEGDYYAQISNFEFGVGNSPCEAWLISPTLDFTGYSNLVFTFINAYKFDGPALEVLISIDYDPTVDPNASTWTDLNPVLSSGDFDWVNSGELNLDAYATSGVNIAFKYTGSASDGSTWEVDDLQISGAQ